MKNIYIFFVFFSITLTCISQGNGFFGKKNYVDFGIDIYSPFLYNFHTTVSSNVQGYVNNNGVLEERMPRLNYGFHTTISRVLQNNIAIGLEAGLSYFLVAPIFFSDGSTNYNYSFLELMEVRKTTIMPKFEFAYNDALLPIGVSNQIGIGFNTFKAIEKDYLGTVTYFNDFGNTVVTDVTKDNYYDFQNQEKIKGYTIMYKLIMRIPLNKSFLYHFGFRYTFNFVPNVSFILGEFSNDVIINNDFVLSQRDLEYSIKVKENRSLIMFETGITFAF